MDTVSESHEEKISQLASLTGADALAAMGSSAAGLMSDQAAKLQAKYGKNLIQAAKKNLQSWHFSPTLRISWLFCCGRRALSPGGGYARAVRCRVVGQLDQRML